MDSKTAILYSQLNSYKALVNKTRGFVRWALEHVENPYVACSFGKDSAVLLHMCLRLRPDIPVRFIRWEIETDLIDNYDEVINEWGPLNLTQIMFSRKSLSDIVKDRYSCKGFDSYFIGLRKEESTARRITLKTRGKFYKNKEGLIRISPLADWTEKDITSYIITNNLPTLNAYKINGFSSRTASRIPRADYGIREHFLNELKKRDFQSYQKLINNFPEIKSL